MSRDNLAAFDEYVLTFGVKVDLLLGLGEKGKIRHAQSRVIILVLLAEEALTGSQPPGWFWFGFFFGHGGGLWIISLLLK